MAKPHPGPQTLFLSLPDTVQIVMYGGARGGGKTFSTALHCARKEERYGEAFSCIVVRRKRTDLRDLIKQYNKILSKLGWTFNRQTKEFFGPNGGTILCHYAETDDDIEALKGNNITDLILEEVTTWPPRMIRELFRLLAILRSADGVPVRLILTTNPNGVGAGLIKELFVDNREPFQIFDFGFKDEEEDAEVLRLKAVFIPATVEDNPSLDLRSYEANLRVAAAGNDALFRAWRFGVWERIEGLAFPEFSRRTHGLTEFRVPGDWGLVGGLDFGFRDPSVFLLAAVSPGGDDFVVVKEVSWKEKTAREAGKFVAKALLREGVPAKMTINCDGQMWAKTGGTAGTIADEFQAGMDEEMGVQQSPVMVNIAHGPGAISMRFNLIKRFLAFEKDELGVVKPWAGPKLRVIEPETQYLCKVFESLALSTKRENAYDTDGDDHPIDSLGYLLVGTASSVFIRQSIPTTSNRDRHPGLGLNGQRIRVRDGLPQQDAAASWFQFPSSDDWVSPEQ